MTFMRWLHKIFIGEPVVQPVENPTLVFTEESHAYYSLLGPHIAWRPLRTPFPTAVGMNRFITAVLTAHYDGKRFPLLPEASPCLAADFFGNTGKTSLPKTIVSWYLIQAELEDLMQQVARQSDKAELAAVLQSLRAILKQVDLWTKSE